MMKCQLCGATAIERQAGHANSVQHLQSELQQLQVQAHQLGLGRPVLAPPTKAPAPSAPEAAAAIALLAPGPLARTRLVTLWKAKDRRVLAVVAATWRCLRLIAAQEGTGRRA